MAPDTAGEGTLCGGGIHLRRIMFCPHCDQRRRFVVLLAVWYSPISTCCACGDAFADGEPMERPFTQDWRRTASAKARRRWGDAGAATKAMKAHQAALDEELA